MLRRAYSRLQIKSLDAAQRVITGIATSASTDRMGDVVEPDGAQFALPIPLLWQHDAKSPIGEVFAAKTTPAGIDIQARIAQTDTPGALKDRLDLAWQSITMQLVRGLSIGFQSIEEAYNTDTGGYHFLKWLWLELSAVTIPANADASIATIKALDVGLTTKAAMARHTTPVSVGVYDAAAQEAKLPSPMPMATAQAMYAGMDPSMLTPDGLMPTAAGMMPHHDVNASGMPGAANLTACADGCAVMTSKAMPMADVQTMPLAVRTAMHAHLAQHLTDGKMPVPPMKDVAATGQASIGTHTPGVSGSTRVVSMRTDSHMKKSYADQIAGFEATRVAKTAKMDSILEQCADAGTTLDAAQKEEHDTLVVDVKEIDEHLDRLRAAEAREKKAAAPVKGNDPLEAATSRTPRITVERKLPPGFLFARYAICMANSRGIPGEAIRLAKEHYREDPGVLALVEKTAVAGGATTGSHWLDDMVPYNVMQDFIEFLRPGSIIGKFGGPNPGGGGNYPALNRVGFNERVSGMSTGFTAGWKGEGLPALPSAAVTFNTSLLWNCMSALAVLTKEAIRFSNPSAEERVRTELARAVNGKLDLDFVDPAKAASGTTSPASITNAIVATTPTGTTAAYVRTDLATLIAHFASNNLDPADIVLIMSAQMALQLSMMVNTLGNNDFPDINMRGGSLRGFPVIVSEHLTAVGSPSTQTIVAVKASDVYLADDGVVTVEASDQASIQMVDSGSSQSALNGTGASLVSLWQTGAIGLMANREITWKLRRSTAVQYISPAAYKA